MMSKKDYTQMPLSLMLIIIPFCGFLAVETPFLAEFTSFYFLLPFLLLVILTFASLFAAAFSDPGILPRTSLGTKYDSLHPPPNRFTSINLVGQEASLKWCHTCGLWRPPRSSHCSDCDHCVEKFDHREPILSSYRPFNSTSLTFYSSFKIVRGWGPALASETIVFL